MKGIAAAVVGLAHHFVELDAKLEAKLVKLRIT